MQVTAPPLLPLLRSQSQAEVLCFILLNPDREWSLTQVAVHTGVSLPTTQREVARAELAGVLRSRKSGNIRWVQAANSPLTEPLTELLLRAFGPAKVLAEALGDMAGVDAAMIYGSWAARYLGQIGRSPADIDVLILGDPDRDELDDVATAATRRVGREVNPIIRPTKWWAEGTDSFHETLTQRPHFLLANQKGIAL
ncbi:MAG: ArsR family transcriptional regulator [Angustibacter sp.]